MKVADNMDSVFASRIDESDDFDVMFDQEDSLIDTVNGVNEAGDPLTGVDFEDLHQTQDDATVNDVKDVPADDDKMGAPNPEGTKDPEDLDVSVKGEVNKDSEADKFFEGETKDPEPKPEEDVNDNIEKVIESEEPEGFLTDEIEKELENEAQSEAAVVKEGEVADPDVVSAVDGEFDDDSDAIDAAMGVSVPVSKYEYDPSDEDLINNVMNN